MNGPSGPLFNGGKMFKILLLLLLISCVSQPIQKLNPEVYYKNDLCFSYKKQGIESFCGVGVVPHKEEYKIKVKSKGKANLFMMTTCHREITSENPDKGLFKKDGVVKISYKPGLEKGKACPLFISSYDRKGRHGWGMVALEDPRFSLKAKVRCNGVDSDSNGVSACQSKVGLLQSITFEDDVKQLDPVNGSAQREKDCPQLRLINGKKVLFSIPPRECIYGFISKKNRKVHKLYTIGYEEIIVRE